MKENTRVISFSGKGGSGKTTTSSLFLANILSTGLFRDILVIDADPDANLTTTLGVIVEKTVGQVLDKRKKELDNPQENGSKLRFALWETITHADGFDILVMGRSTGAGCYCSVNTMLNSLLEDTLSMYDLVLIDFDAGLEHFSRRTGTSSDTLIVTCDPSRLSFDTAKRIKDLVEELNLPYAHQYVVGCRYKDDQRVNFMEMSNEADLNVLGFVPWDQEISDYNLEGESLLRLSQENKAKQIVGEMVNKILLL